MVQNSPQVSEAEYEAFAIAFLNAPIGGTILEGVRFSNGDFVRFDTSTEALAVMRKDGVVRTFFKPDKAWHGFSSNLAYFQNKCAK
jgi:pyocin large subunit-like protein